MSQNKTFIDYALERTRTVVSALVLLLIAGIQAYDAIPKESFPDINIPIIYVSLRLEGISPEDSERLLLRPMEQELKSIEGVKEMRATAYQGGGNVVMEFDAGFDVDKALDDVREKVDLARPELPDDADEPTVNEVNFSLFPVIVVALSGPVPERTLVTIARDLQDDLEGLSTVLSADIAGDREEAVEVIIDPAKVESYNLQGPDLVTFFSRNNRLVAAGNLDTGEGRFAVKVPGLIEDLEDILSMPVVADRDAVVTVGDIATIRSTYKDPEGFARINGERSVALDVVKRTGKNVIETIEQVKAIVAEHQQRWPETVRVTYTQDNSTEIKTMLTDLQNNVISAILLVMIICVAALGLRTGFLVGVAIPGSFLIGILTLSLFGINVNNVVLFSLILSVGMLVDGAVIVTEYADRKMAEGLHRREAYALASKRMALPVIASTATTLAAFFPLLFWPGVVGEFMKFLPLTLVITLIASLLMALIFVPALGSLFGKAGDNSDAETMAALSGTEKVDISKLHGLTGGYVRVLQKALRRPALVVAMAFVFLVGIQIAYGIFGNGVEFFPEEEPSFAQVLIQARGNLSVYEKDALVREVEDKVLPIEGIRIVYTSSGGGSAQSGQDDVPLDVIGTLSLEFEDWDERPKADVILQQIREATASISGIRVETRKQQGGPPVGKPIQLELSSLFPDLLEPTAAHIRAVLDEVGGFVDVEDSRPLPGIEWELEVDRAQAAKFGLDVSTIGQSIRLVTNGLILSTYRPEHTDDEVDVLARFPVQDRTLDQLDRIRVETAQGSVPVSNFVKRTARQQVGELDRVDSRRVMTVKADVPPDVLPNDKLLELRDALMANPPDPRVNIEFKGENEEQQESQAFLSQAFSVALFIMAIILITQFNSFYSGFLILTAVIMSTIGVMMGLLITGQPFGIVMSGIGVIALAGIVVNNNIVLIDTFDRLVKEAPTVMDAILKTGAQRLRPVLLTTITTILGLMPMVLAMNIDFITREVTIGAPSTQWWIGLATAIAFGLAFSTILTLVVTPCALMLRVRIKEGWAWVVGKVLGQRRVEVV